MSDHEVKSLLDHVVAALRASTLNDNPWPHCYLVDALPAAVTADLECSFDRVNLAPVEGTDRNKTYRMHTRRVDLTDDVATPSPAWWHLLNALRDTRYRDALAELTGVPLDGTRMTIDLWEYRDGDWLAAHVDKPDKVVTQLFYFCRDWQPEVGGHLLVLDSAGAEDHPYERLEPVTGASAILVRSESSWHAVEATRGAGASRCSVAVTFWRSPAAGTA